jgi:hypothetical protein
MIIAADLLAVVALIIALLILFAFKSFAHAVASLVPNWHILGFGRIRDWIVSAINDAYNAVALALDAQLYLIERVGAACWHWMEAVARVPGDVFAEVHATLLWLVETEIPKLIGIASRALSAALSRVESYAKAGLAAVERDIDIVKAGLHGLIVAAVAGVLAPALARIATLEGIVGKGGANILKDVKTAETVAEGVAAAGLADASKALAAGYMAADGVLRAGIADVSSALQSSIAQVENDISTVETTVVTTVGGILSTDIEHVIGPIADAVNGAVAGAVTAADGAFTDITDWLGEIDLTKVVDVAGVAATAAATTAALARYLEDCGMPNCRNLSKYGRDLQALLGLAGDVSFLGLLVEIATNPSGAAHDIEDTIGTIVGDTVSTAKTMLQLT